MLLDNSHKKTYHLQIYQERRKIEDQYALSLRKLARKPLQETGGDLGYGVLEIRTRYLLIKHVEYSMHHGERL